MSFRISARIVLAVLVVAGWLASAHAEVSPDYAVLISAECAADKGWFAVAQALKEKHGAVILTNSAADCGPLLQKSQPRYLCLVAKPVEIDVDCVRYLHLVTRAMDADPYGDCLWGIITGATPDDALRIAKAKDPLVVKNALTTTGVDTGLYDTCLTLSDGREGDWLIKTNGQVYHGNKTNTPASPSEILTDFYHANPVDLFVTSGHATEVNLETPFSSGALVAGGERLYSVNRQGLRSYVREVSGGQATGGLWFQGPESSKRRLAWSLKTTETALKPTANPKIFIAAGNCLIGDAMKTTDSLVVLFLSHYGVNQFVGYTTATWFGKGGWGTLGLWQGSEGQRTLSEAFYLNNQRIVKELLDLCPDLMQISLDSESLALMTGEKKGPPTPALLRMSKAVEALEPAKRKEAVGLLYDRDTVAFYGDPKWEARADITKRKPRVEWSWSNEADRQVLTLKSDKGLKADDALVFLLPKRSPGAKVEGGEPAVVNDEFLWLKRTDLEAGKPTRLVVAP